MADDNKVKKKRMRGKVANVAGVSKKGGKKKTSGKVTKTQHKKRKVYGGGTVINKGKRKGRKKPPSKTPKPTPVKLKTNTARVFKTANKKGGTTASTTKKSKIA